MLKSVLRPVLSPVMSGVMAVVGAMRWTPKALYGGLPGALFDVYDLSSVPGATVNTKVTTIYDKSGNACNVTQGTDSARATLRGTPSGANLVTDPFFYSGADWTFGAGWANASPVASATTASSDLARPSVAAVVGKVYLVKFVVQARSAGSVLFTFGGVTGTARSAAGVYYETITATSTASFVLTGTGFTGTVRGVSVWDVSAGSVKAPYWLEFNGTSNFYSASANITAYPFTFAASSEVLGGGINSILALYQADADTKILDHGNGRGLDWKEGVISSYAGAYTANRQQLTAEFATGSNITEADLLAGSAATHSNTFGTKTSLFLGKGIGSSFYMNGRIYSAMSISRVLTAAEKIQLGVYYGADKALQCWGDSMTAGSGTGVTTGYPLRLSAAIDRPIENKGAGGETSTQITARFVADTTNKDRWTNILWMGTNDALTSGQEAAWISLILSNIATCVSGLKGAKRHIVIGAVRADGGSVPGSLLDSLDAALLGVYGDKFLNVRVHLQSLNDGSANDLADIALGLVPRSLRSDIIHLNDKGYQHVADLLAATLEAKGWL